MISRGYRLNLVPQGKTQRPTVNDFLRLQTKLSPSRNLTKVKIQRMCAYNNASK